MSKPTFLTLFFFLASYGSAQTQPVPAEYQEAYTTLNTDISSFQTTLNSVWDQSKFPVVTSAQLLSANSQQTTDLLQPNYFEYNVLSEMNELQALGVKSFTIHINFPSMYQPYYTNPADYQSYLGFYNQVVNEIRARGLKLIIQTTSAVVYPGNNSQSFIPYYQSLDWPTYESQRAQLAASLAQLFHPDYLILVDEPDTEATTTGQVNAGTVSGSTDMVQGMIAAIQETGVTGVQIGAGCGSWDPSFLQFIESFGTLPLNTLDMHIYPVNLSNLPDALTAVGLIQAAGKQPSMSEMWSYKETDAEYNAHLSYTTIYARDGFSFWSPIDISFLKLMSDFGNYGHFAFVSPYWSSYLAAYIDFAQDGALPQTTIITDAETAAVNATTVGQYTPTGLFYESLMIGAPDLTPPATPAAPTVTAYSQTQAQIVWTPTTDNIGVAAYNLYRDSKLIDTISGPMTYADLSLQPDTKYTYTVAAFDASGNLSAQSAPLTMTTYSYPDNTPPSVPTGVQATATSDTTIGLVWIPSTDNVAVAGYEIYRGTSPTSIVPYSSSTTSSFVDAAVWPATAFYYQVDAFDTSGNHSARSAVVTAKSLPDVTPPTVPGNVAVTAVAGPVVTVSWTASMDAFPMVGYQIYRGTSSTSLQLIGWSAVPQLSFVDPYAISGKTYYYSVAGMDEYKNVSALSPPVIVSVP